MATLTGGGEYEVLLHVYMSNEGNEGRAVDKEARVVSRCACA